MGEIGMAQRNSILTEAWRFQLHANPFHKSWPVIVSKIVFREGAMPPPRKHVPHQTAWYKTRSFAADVSRESKDDVMNFTRVGVGGYQAVPGAF
jgi:hypothetical protein